MDAKKLRDLDSREFDASQPTKQTRTAASKLRLEIDMLDSLSIKAAMANRHHPQLHSVHSVSLHRFWSCVQAPGMSEKTADISKYSTSQQIRWKQANTWDAMKHVEWQQKQWKPGNTCGTSQLGKHVGYQSTWATRGIPVNLGNTWDTSKLGKHVGYQSTWETRGIPANLGNTWDTSQLGKHVGYQ